jgi:hypothetical protein
MDANQIYLIAVDTDNVRRVLVRYVSLFFFEVDATCESLGTSAHRSFLLGLPYLSCYLSPSCNQCWLR